MGETVKREHDRIPKGTLQAIQKRIITLVDGSIPPPLGYNGPSEARFRVPDPKTNNTQIISPSIDFGGILGIEIPTRVEVQGSPQEQVSATSPFFRKLSMNRNSLFPRIHSVERGYYDPSGKRHVVSVEDSLTEVEAHEFFTALNSANKENEIDVFGQTRQERKGNKEKADTLRNEIDHLIRQARDEKMLAEYGNITTTEQARYKLGDTKIIVLKIKETGACVIDIQSDESFTYLPDQDGEDDIHEIVRPRQHYIIRPSTHGDQRIHYRQVFDPVREGEIIITPIDIDDEVNKDSGIKIAQPHEVRDIYNKITMLRKEHLLPPSRRDPDEFQGI